MYRFPAVRTSTRLLVGAALVAAFMGGMTRSHGAAASGRASAAATAVDPVIEWNQILLGILRTPGAQPATVHPTRSLAIMHAAVYDAVDAIDQTFTPYLVRVAAPRKASRPAAAVAAAHEVLVSLYPSLRDSLDAQYAVSLARVPDGHAKQAGIAVGEELAQRLLHLRSADGSNATPPPYVTTGAPGDYRPTPPANAAPVFMHWSAVLPFALRRASQFRPAPPPALTSADYAEAIQEVQSLGSIDSSTRSADQTQVGKFWGAPIQNYWNEIAQTEALAHGTSLAQNARLFALLNLTFADAVIAFYDGKYTYRLWRPITAIRAADSDGNPATIADPTWTPLAPTAPDPSYPGAHSTVSAAGANVLASFFGGDQSSFAVRSEVLPGVERSFTSFSAAATEAGLSRIYAGQHSRLDDVSGQKLGRSLASYVLQNLLRPRHEHGEQRGEGTEAVTEPGVASV